MVSKEENKQKPVAVFDEQLGRPCLVAGAPMLEHGQPLYTHPAPVAKQKPSGWLDEQTGDYSRVNRLGWSALYLHPVPVNTAQSDDAILRAWQAGYYEAGYTHDQAYADKMAREYLEATKK